MRVSAPVLSRALVSVAVVVAVGASTTSALAATAPDAPFAGPTVTAGDRSAGLQWGGVNDGGSPVTSYDVEVSPARAGQPAPDVLSFSETTFSATITGLTGGADYGFRYRASNAVGPGPWSTFTTVTAGALPSAPTLTSTVAGDRSVSVAWSAADGNGYPIDGYLVTWSSTSPSYYNELTLSADARSYTVTGLNNGQTYTVTVAAHNTWSGGDAPGRGPAASSGALTPSLGGVSGLSATPSVSWPSGQFVYNLHFSWQPPGSGDGVRICLDPDGQAACSYGGFDTPAPGTSADSGGNFGGIGPTSGRVISALVYDSAHQVGPATTYRLAGAGLTDMGSVRVITYGTGTTLATTLSDPATGAALAGLPVTLYSRLIGSSAWSAVATVTTDSAGHAAQWVHPTNTRDYRFVYLGSSTRMPTSNYTTVGVRYAVRAKLTKLKVRHGATDVLYGTVAPALKGVRVDARAGNGSIRAWSTVKYQRLPDGRTTWGFVIPFSVRKASTIRVWALASGNYRNAGALSPKIKLIVT